MRQWGLRSSRHLRIGREARRKRACTHPLTHRFDSRERIYASDAPNPFLRFALRPEPPTRSGARERSRPADDGQPKKVRVILGGREARSAKKGKKGGRESEGEGERELLPRKRVSL